jgi:hypothetical protein
MSVCSDKGQANFRVEDAGAYIPPVHDVVVLRPVFSAGSDDDGGFNWRHINGEAVFSIEFYDDTRSSRDHFFNVLHGRNDGVRHVVDNRGLRQLHIFAWG